MSDRKVVFIGHANPEDNDFASWLGSRLATVGYDVWVDVLALTGGEKFSPGIEDVIRKSAAIVAVVLSRASHRKEGVLNEITLASQVARARGDERFLLPIIVDDLPLVDFPADLVRTQHIDARDWAHGLSALLEMLAELRVPRSEGGNDDAMAAFHAVRTQTNPLRTVEPELHYSNWFRLGSFPPRIRFSRFLPGSDVESAFKEFKSPARQYNRLAVSFADAEALMAEAPTVGLEHAYEVCLDEFLSGIRKKGLPGISRHDARNILIALLNQAWARAAEQRGLLPREFVGGHSWFVPAGMLENGRAAYADENGNTGWRQLVGQSKARGIYWHFAVSARVSIADPSYYEMRSHVVFSENGKEPLDGPRAKNLRRSFCKNWWNPRWRDLLRAFMANFAHGAEYIELPLGPSTSVSLATKSVRFHAPFSVDGDAWDSPCSDDSLSTLHDPDHYFVDEEDST